MKIVKRIGVFETNSSSTHSLILVKKDVWEKDKEQEKPKYKRYGTLMTAEDKLYMACGCCWEIFEEVCGYVQEDDRDEQFDEELQEVGVPIYLDINDFTYTSAVRLLIEEYCRITGKDYEPVYQKIDKINHSGRPCHMKFFEEGALYSSTSDYDAICNLFHGEMHGIRKKIADYFDESNVLCYKEYWGGMRWDDED